MRRRSTKFLMKTMACLVAGVFLLGTGLLFSGSKETKTIIFLAGRKSHGYGSHEHRAGCLLLADCIKKAFPGVTVKVFEHGWPKEPGALEGASTIVVYSDGQGSHVLTPHLAEADKLMKKGTGLVLLHYAVEPVGHERREQGGPYFLDWVGGFYEKFWSVNPHWMAKFTEFPKHPVARGLKPFSAQDEWYFPMRYVKDMKGVAPILTTVPPDKARMGRDGSHSGNPHVRARKGMPEHVAWTYERPGGGRGFGFTGGHFHWNWANDSFRTAVLNGIVWTAGIDVPEGGVPSKTPTLEELKANQDYPEPRNFNWAHWKELLARWRSGSAN